MTIECAMEKGETYPPIDEEQRIGVRSVEEWKYEGQEHKNDNNDSAKTWLNWLYE